MMPRESVTPDGKMVGGPLPGLAMLAKKTQSEIVNPSTPDTFTALPFVGNEGSASNWTPLTIRPLPLSTER